jgi:hypothetical protein
MFHLPLRLLYGLAALEERMPSDQTWVLVQNLIRVIFEDMDPIWLRSMWETGRSTCTNMIKISISLALLKLKSKL